MLPVCIVLAVREMKIVILTHTELISPRGKHEMRNISAYLLTFDSGINYTQISLH